MTAPAPLDLPAVLDDLRTKALAIRKNYPSLPVLRQKGADVEAVWSDGADMTWIECEEPAVAALIVAAVNALPTLIAAVRRYESIRAGLSTWGDDLDPLQVAALRGAMDRAAHALAAHLALATPPAQEEAP